MKEKYPIEQYKCRDGSVIKIREMVDSHLVNAYKYFMKCYKKISREIKEWEEIDGIPECLDDFIYSPVNGLYLRQKMFKALMTSLEMERKKRKLKVDKKFEYEINNSDFLIMFG